MRKRVLLLLAALLAIPLVLLATAAAWIAAEVWRYQHRPGAILSRNFPNIRPGMRLEEVNALLGMAGREIVESEVPRVVDWDVPVEAPKRLKPVVAGEKFYQWETNDGAYVIVSLKGGSVSEKDLYEPSL